MGFIKKAFPLSGGALASDLLKKKKTPTTPAPMMTLTNRSTNQSGMLGRRSSLIDGSTF